MARRIQLLSPFAGSLERAEPRRVHLRRPRPLKARPCPAWQSLGLVHVARRFATDRTVPAGAVKETIHCAFLPTSDDREDSGSLPSRHAGARRRRELLENRPLGHKAFRFRHITPACPRRIRRCIAERWHEQSWRSRATAETKSSRSVPVT